MRNLLASQWGRAFEALRDSPIATDAMGVGTYRHKVAAFALGSSLGGLAGGLYAFNFQYLQPQSFTYDLMIILLLGVVLGRPQEPLGRLRRRLGHRPAAQSALEPAPVPALLGPGLRRPWRSGLRGLVKKTTRPFQAMAPVVAMGILVVGGFLVENTEDWRKAIFALMLFSVVVGLPEGLMGFLSIFLAKLFRVPQAPLPEPSDIETILPPRVADGSPCWCWMTSNVTLAA